MSNKVETSPYPSCPRHAHHTVTVRDWFHLCLNCIIYQNKLSILTYKKEKI